MSKVIFDSGISLDGFFTGDNRSPSNPMGGVSGKIHTWMLNQWHYENTWEWKAVKKTDLMVNLSGRPLQEQVLTLWENECLKKVMSVGRKIYTMQMFKC